MIGTDKDKILPVPFAEITSLKGQDVPRRNRKDGMLNKMAERDPICQVASNRSRASNHP